MIRPALLALLTLLPLAAAGDTPPLLQCEYHQGDDRVRYTLLDRERMTLAGQFDGGDFHCADRVEAIRPCNDCAGTGRLRVDARLDAESCQGRPPAGLNPAADLALEPDHGLIHLRAGEPPLRCGGFNPGRDQASRLGLTGHLPNDALRRHIGHRPGEPVDGIAFLDEAAVREGVGAAAPAAVREWVFRREGPRTPVEERDGWLLAWGCEAHNCGPHHWTIRVTPNGAVLELCYYDQEEDADSSLWYREGADPARRPGQCPQ